MLKMTAIEYEGKNRETIRIQRDGEEVYVIANNRVQLTFTKADRSNFVAVSAREKLEQLVGMIVPIQTANDDEVEALGDLIDLM